jgi:hypothetical protein
MSISQNFPDISPSLNLNFAGARKLDSRITFTRGSTGTYMDDNGLIRTAGINQARFDHSYDGSDIESLGLLIEESRVNYALYSNDYTQSTSTINASVVANTTIAPDGTQTASTITSSSGSAQHGSTKNTTGLPIDSICSLSVFVKAGTSNYCRVDSANVTNWSSNAGIAVNLTNGSIISGSGTVVSFPNGWYRITIFPTTNSSSGVTRGLWVWVSDSSGNSTTTAVGTESINVWGAQIEAGAFPTSYIPTSGSTATRSADNASITGTNFSSWYNQSEGTTVVECENVGTKSSNFQVPIGYRSDLLSSATTIEVFQQNGSFYYLVRLTDPLDDQVGINVNMSSTINSYIRYSFAYKENDFGYFINNTLYTDSSGSLPSGIDEAAIGSNGNTTRLNGHIRRISYYPKRLTNIQLQELTK